MKSLILLTLWLTFTQQSPWNGPPEEGNVTQCGTIEKRQAQRTRIGIEASIALTPFHTICTPMQTSRKEVSRIITLIAVGPRICASRSANP